MRTWEVGALCKALGEALEARFNPVTVRGELSGFTRASSGHCYFSLKDAQAQIRCVMFKRTSGMLDFVPRDGMLVELRGRVSLYEPRGDLQLMVESMRQAGAGAMFERFMQLKAKLEREGLFDLARKRGVPVMPRAIAVVTSLGAAALRDVISTLRRRAPHVPVVVVPAPVQGTGAPTELALALERLYAMVRVDARGIPPGSDANIDAILLVRGGGSIEDLWAFNDEFLARTIARSPVPIVCGVGHETDFTIADFVADVRAPTPTAAAELVATSQETWLDTLEGVRTRLGEMVGRRLDRQSQRVDGLAARLVRPSSLLAAQRYRLSSIAGRLQLALQLAIGRKNQSLQQLQQQIPIHLQRGIERRHHRLLRAQSQLALLDPKLVLQRGYAWLVDEAGRTITDPAQTHPGQLVKATLSSGTLNLQVPQQV